VYHYIVIVAVVDKTLWDCSLANCLVIHVLKQVGRRKLKFTKMQFFSIRQTQVPLKFCSFTAFPVYLDNAMTLILAVPWCSTTNQLLYYSILEYTTSGTGELPYSRRLPYDVFFLNREKLNH